MKPTIEAAVAAVIPRGVEYTVCGNDVEIHRLPASLPLWSPEEIAWSRTQPRFRLSTRPALFYSAEVRALLAAIDVAVRPIAGRCSAAIGLDLMWAHVPARFRHWTGDMYVWTADAPEIAPLA